MSRNDYSENNLAGQSSHDFADPQLDEYKQGINAAAEKVIEQLNPEGLEITDKVVLTLKKVVLFFVDVQEKNIAEAAFHKLKLSEVITALLSKVERMMHKGQALEKENEKLREENEMLKGRLKAECVMGEDCGCVDDHAEQGEEREGGGGQGYGGMVEDAGMFAQADGDVGVHGEMDGWLDMLMSPEWTNAGLMYDAERDGES